VEAALGVMWVREMLVRKIQGRALTVDVAKDVTILRRKIDKCPMKKLN